MGELPQPGLIQRGVPANEYHAWPAASSSGLHILATQTPAHLRHYLDTCGGESSESQELGTLVHLAVLEPEKFTAGVIAAPVCDRRTKLGKETWEAFQSEHSSKWAVNRDLFGQVVEMRDSIMAHPTAREMFEGKGISEASGVWVEDGMTCKFRTDRLTMLGGWGVVADLKTTRDAARRQFERSIFQYGYYIQGAHYLAGCEAVAPQVAGSQHRRYMFVCIENVAPYCVAVYELDDYAIEEGEIQRKRALAIWRKCQETGEWPGYGDGADVVGLPAWATKVFAESSE